MSCPLRRATWLLGFRDEAVVAAHPVGKQICGAVVFVAFFLVR